MRGLSVFFGMRPFIDICMEVLMTTEQKIWDPGVTPGGVNILVLCQLRLDMKPLLSFSKAPTMAHNHKRLFMCKL